jgi:fibronectin-binding autotransporter adhesin
MKFKTSSALALIFLSYLPVLKAATLTWDADNATSGPQDGSGTWLAGSGNWYDSVNSIDNQTFTQGDTVTFGAASGAAGTITLSGTVQTSSLTFSPAGSGNYTLAGGTALELNGSTNTINTSTDATITSLITRTNPLLKTGSGNLTINSNSTANDGTITISRGQISFNNISAFGAAAANTITLGDANTGSSVTSLNFTEENTAARTTVNNIIVSAEGAGEVRIGRTTSSPTIATIDHTFSGTVAMNRGVTLFNSAGANKGQQRHSGAFTGTGDITIDSNFVIAFRQANNANTFNGNVIIKSNAVFQLGANDSATNQIPNGSNILFQGSTANFRLSNGGETVAGLSSLTTGFGQVTTNRTTAGGGSITLTISPASDSFVFGGPINDQAANAVSWKLNVTKSGAGSQTLSSLTSGYSGNTTVSAGVLEISKLANGGSNSSIGKSTNAASSLVLNGGSLIYNGAGDTTDRLFTIGGSCALINNGSGALNFNNTANLAHTNTGTDRTLTLGGSNVDPNTFSPLIADASPGITSLRKIGSCTWILPDLNSYTGKTIIEDGTLSIGAEDTLSNLANVEISNTGILNLNHSLTDEVGLLIIDGVAQSPGKWGRTGSIASLGADFETPRITGDGLLITNDDNADMYWDASGTSWNSAAAWSLVPTDGASNPSIAPGANNATRFSTEDIFSDQTIALNGDIVTKQMIFSSALIHTFVGGDANHSLTVAAAGITVNTNGLAPIFGSATPGQAVNLILDQSQTWRNDNASLGDALTTLNDVDLAANALTLSGIGRIDFKGTIKGTGSIRKLGSGTTEFAGIDTFTGDKIIDNGTVTISGNHTAATGSWQQRGYSDTGTAYNTIATTVTQNVGSSITIDTGKSLSLGNSAPSGGFNEQRFNANGTVSNLGSLILGRSSRLNIAGSFTQTGPATIATQGGGIAAVYVTSDGHLLYENASAFILRTSTSTNTLTNLTIDGGLVTTGVNFRNDTATAATGTSAGIILTNEGTLKCSANISDLFTSAGASTRIILGGGNGIIDTNSFSSSLSIPIEGSGNLIKKGAGVFTCTVGHTYTGTTTVQAGELVISAANLADNRAVTIDTGAKLNLNYTGTDTILALTLGGTNMPAGTYNATSHPDFISGSGSLVVPVIDPFVTWVAGFFPGETNAAIIGKAADPDGDGQSNQLEFALDGNPNNGAASRKMVNKIATVGEDEYLTLTIPVRGTTPIFTGTGPLLWTTEGLTYSIQGSLNLGSFTASISEVVPALSSGMPALSSGWTYKTFQLNSAISAESKGFLRVETTTP